MAYAPRNPEPASQVGGRIARDFCLHLLLYVLLGPAVGCFVFLTLAAGPFAGAAMLVFPPGLALAVAYYAAWRSALATGVLSFFVLKSVRHRWLAFAMIAVAGAVSAGIDFEAGENWRSWQAHRFIPDIAAIMFTGAVSAAACALIYCWLKRWRSKRTDVPRT